MLRRGLSFAPDALIANGDHVYWDLLAPRAAPKLGASKAALEYARFDRDAPILGGANESALLRAAGEQITPLYGTLCRSTPVFFLQDDHDHFDNDEATDEAVTFPPDNFMLQSARATQRLWYPEFLPDPNRSPGLPGSDSPDQPSYRPSGLSESFGTLRYGRLAEVLLYDVRRTVTLAGPTAVFVAPDVEAWVKARAAAKDVIHLVNVPSNPPGWSAGKWGEWYPDLLGPDGKLSEEIPKPYWQRGWLSQHDRLMQALSAMPGRIPLVVSGDLHAIGEGRMLRSGHLNFANNPVIAVLPGPEAPAKAAGLPSSAALARSPRSTWTCRKRLRPSKKMASFWRTSHLKPLRCDISSGTRRRNPSAISTRLSRFIRPSLDALELLRHEKLTLHETWHLVEMTIARQPEAASEPLATRKRFIAMTIEFS